MKKKSKIILIIIAILVIGGIVAAVIFSPKKQPQYTFDKASVGILKQTVSATGKVKPQKVVDLSFENTGIVKNIFVKVGDSVKKGQSLIQLDNRNDSIRLNIAQASLKIAESNLKMNQTNNLQSADTAYQKALQDFQNLKSKNKRALEAANVDLEEAENYTQDYQNYFNDIEKQYQDGTVTFAVRDLTRATLTNVQSAERKARETLETLELSQKQSEQETQFLVEQTRQTLEEQKALAFNPEKSNLIQQVNYSKANLELTKLALSKNSFGSPINGIVSKINITEGEAAHAMTTVMTVIASEREIEADIPESDINKIQIGQNVDLTFDAVENKTFAGKVESIDPAETIQEGVTYYKVKIYYLDPDKLTRSGMSADLNIKILEKDNVLTIASRAVKQKNGQNYVQILSSEDKTVKDIPVATGLKGDSGRIEIISGLKEGQEVIIFSKK